VKGDGKKREQSRRMFGSGKTTWRIRNAARGLMRELRRPVSVLEIESWIKERDEGLSKEVSGKSVDYVRVTMSSTGKGEFVKYVSPSWWKRKEGESGKKNYWGEGGVEYGVEWEAIGRSAGKASRRKGEGEGEGEGAGRGEGEGEGEAARVTARNATGMEGANGWKKRESEMESEPEAEGWIRERSKESGKGLEWAWEWEWEWEQGDLFGCNWREPEQLDFDWDW
jgi:hypothetical protein